MSASQIKALVKRAQVAVLGSLGAGAAGSVTNNGTSILNAAFVAPATTVTFTAAPHVSVTGRVLVIAHATASNTHGATLAAGDEVTFQILGLGGVAIDGAHTAGAVVAADATLAWIDTPAPGAPTSYAVTATVAGGHTAAFEATQAQITVIDI